MKDETHVPEFRRLVLTTPDEVRAHCLARGPTNTNFIALTVRGDEFRYKIRPVNRRPIGTPIGIQKGPPGSTL
jgi:hypothetical protein